MDYDSFLKRIRSIYLLSDENLRGIKEMREEYYRLNQSKHTESHDAIFSTGCTLIYDAR